MNRPAQRHAPDKMTCAYNRTMALSKVDTCPLDKINDAMIDSIARTHRVPVADLQQRLAARRWREVPHG